MQVTRLLSDNDPEPVFGKAGPDARAGLERDVRAGWRDFETIGGMDLEVGITTAYARK